MKRIAAPLARTAAMGAVALVCLAPILWGLAETIRFPSVFGEAFASGTFERLLRSVTCALLATAIAIALGVPLVLSGMALPPRGRWIAMAMIALPFVMPPYLYALAWIEAVGIVNRVLGGAPGVPAIGLYSIQGVVALEAIRFTPIAAFTSAVAVRSIDAAQIEASLMCRGAGATFWHVLIPSVRPVLIAASFAIFVLALSDYSIASLLQVDLYPIDVQTRFSADYDVPGAFALTVPLLGIGFAALLTCSGLMRRWTRESGADSIHWESDRPALLNRVHAVGVITAFAGLAVVLPAAVVVYRIGSVGALRDAWQSTADEFHLSASVAFASTAIAMAVATSYAALISRRWFLIVAASAPLLITGPAFGIGAILVWNHPDWRGAVYDSEAILVLVQTGRVMFIAMLGVILGLAAQPRDFHHAAALAGVPPLMRFLGIGIPLALPALAVTASIAFLLAFVDGDAAALVAPPGATPLAVRIAGLMHYGPSELVHAASALSAVLALVLVGAAAFVARKGIKAAP